VPFGWINPCGYEGLRTVQLKDFGVAATVAEVGERLLGHLQRLLPPADGGRDRGHQAATAAANALRSE
jgi:lipoyl(octanoyl) transferase